MNGYRSMLSAVQLRSRRRSVGAALVVAVIFAGLLPGAAAAISGTKPLVVVLCKFTDLSTEPSAFTPAYFEQFFSDAGASKFGLLNYWKDVSYGNLSISGTVVKGWNSLGMTRYEWAGLSRSNKWQTCADTASSQVDWRTYSPGGGVVVIYNDDRPPRAASTTLANGVDGSQTSITVASSSGFPAPPFAVVVDSEELHVTAVSGNAWTVTRDYQDYDRDGNHGGDAVAHAANTTLTLLDGGDLFGFGPTTVTLGNSIGDPHPYTLGGALLPPTTNLSFAAHEVGHSFSLEHSRKLSTSTTDYNDCYDIMSYQSCSTSFEGDFGAQGDAGAEAGPGMNAVQLATAGWLSASSWNECRNGTFTMAALNHPEVSGNKAIRTNDVRTIMTPSPAAGQPPGSTMSDYLSVELRSKSGWDRGIAADAFLLYLHGQDGYSYWVDNVDGVGGNGVLDQPGDWYVNPAGNVYVAVNSISPASYTGEVTLSSCKIDTALTQTGSTEADYSDQVTLSARLEVSGSLAELPRRNVTFTLGSQSCEDSTDVDGAASCTIRLTQTPGSYTLTASFAGEPAFEPASASRAFTIDREDTTLTYGGALTSKYHDGFTASATLADADSGIGLADRAIAFELGSGDTCVDSTDSAGSASCSITPQQPAGTVNLASSFAGDAYYKPSQDSDAFQITKHETTTTYTGRTVILQGQPLSLSAQLLEHPGVPITGRTLTIDLAGQTCTTASTDAAGNASCTLSSVAAPALGPQKVTATFDGDAYYLPSSETKDVIVFAFPTRGAFVLGDTTVASATPATTVTWWGDRWSTRNSLSGGGVTPSFKGFAGALSSNPPSCGSTWTTGPGNSPPPVSGVPSYMGTLVVRRVAKAGDTFAGTIVNIVVVRTNPGYAPEPKYAGTGTIVATYCP